MAIELVVLFVVGAVLLVAWIFGQARVGLVHVNTVIEIDASKAVVWSVLSDFAEYRQWNPLMIEVHGPAEAGARIDWTSRLNGKTRNYNARIDRADAGEELAWIGPISGIERILFWGVHRFVIDELAPDRVRLVNKEWFGGLLTIPLARFLTRDAKAAYDEANAALKQRAEALADVR